MHRISIAIRTLFALCLLGATFNHLAAIVQHGLLWDYGYGTAISPFSKVYWDTLTILDPLAAVLLFLKPRAGVRLTVLIIASDVLHNTYYVAIHDQWSAPFYLAQAGFLVVVLCLSPLAMRGLSPRNVDVADVRVPATSGNFVASQPPSATGHNRSVDTDA